LALITFSSPSEYNFVTDLGRTSALPLDSFGAIGLSNAKIFRDSTSTSFEAAAFFLLTTGRLEVGFVVVPGSLRPMAKAELVVSRVKQSLTTTLR
jgi:hypothetical protein